MQRTLAPLIAALMLAIALPLSRADEPADKALLRELLKAPSTPPKPNAERSEASDPAPAAPPQSDTPAPPASTGDDTPDSDLTPTEQQFWNMHWHRAASSYAAVDGNYYLCAKWDPRYPNSAYITPGQWQAKNTTTVTRNEGGLLRDKKFSPPAEEAAAAAMTIPELAPNHYGYIHSANVQEVRSPMEMVVSDIQLVDADRVNAEIKAVEQRGQRIIAAQNQRERLERQRDRDRRSSSSGNDRDRYDDDDELTSSDIRNAIEARYKQRLELVKKQSRYDRVQLRLIGYPTAGATVGSRWSGYDPRGPQIAVVDDTGLKAGIKRRSRNVQLVAVNAELLRKGITEQQFTELLANRGMTRRDFVNMAREKLQQTPGDVSDARPVILAALEQARAEQQKQQADPGEGDEQAEGRSDFFQKKYGDKPEGGDKPQKAESDDKKSFFEKKYGDKSKEGKSDKPESRDDGKSFFEKKYGDRDKDKPEAEGDKNKAADEK